VKFFHLVAQASLSSWQVAGARTLDKKFGLSAREPSENFLALQVINQSAASMEIAA